MPFSSNNADTGLNLQDTYLKRSNGSGASAEWRAAAGLTDAQMQEVCEAVRTQRHLGIVCDETQQSPIVGVRFTKPHGADTYDLCEAAFRKLAPQAQEAFEAVPTPDVKIAVANVK